MPRTSPNVRQAARELRKESPRSEQLLWQALRNRGLLGRKFRRQHAVGPFILDFYCAEAGLAVEVDGTVHDTQEIRDSERQVALESLGIRFLRLPAELVERDLPSALAAVEAALTPGPSPTRGRGERMSAAPARPLYPSPAQRERGGPQGRGEG